MFIFNGTCCLTLVRKTLMCDILKLVPSFCSPVTLHSVAAAPKHLRFALRCWSFAPSPTSSDTSTPELSGLPSDPASWNLDMTSPQFRPPSFQGKAFFRQALATLSPCIFLQNEIYQIDYRFTKCPRPWFHGTKRSQCVSGCHDHPAKHASKHRHWTLCKCIYT